VDGSFHQRYYLLYGSGGKRRRASTMTQGHAIANCHRAEPADCLTISSQIS
jgi:hypothetical protein